MAAPAIGVPGAVPTVLQNAINGIATAAANAQDINTVSMLLRIQEWAVQISTTYQAVAATATALSGWPINGYPYNFANADANAIVAKQTGLTGPQLGA